MEGSHGRVSEDSSRRGIDMRCDRTIDRGVPDSAERADLPVRSRVPGRATVAVALQHQLGPVGAFESGLLCLCGGGRAAIPAVRDIGKRGPGGASGRVGVRRRRCRRVGGPSRRASSPPRPRAASQASPPPQAAAPSKAGPQRQASSPKAAPSRVQRHRGALTLRRAQRHCQQLRLRSLAAAPAHLHVQRRRLGQPQLGGNVGDLSRRPGDRLIRHAHEL